MGKLFQPFEVKGLRFKNRVLHEPTTMSMSDPHGHVTDKIVGVYETLAKGGFGSVIVGATCVRHDGLINERMLGIYDDTYVIGFRDLVEVIHSNDSLAGIQLFYGGANPGVWRDHTPQARRRLDSGHRVLGTKRCNPDRQCQAGGGSDRSLQEPG